MKNVKNFRLIILLITLLLSMMALSFFLPNAASALSNENENNNENINISNLDSDVDFVCLWNDDVVEGNGRWWCPVFKNSETELDCFYEKNDNGYSIIKGIKKMSDLSGKLDDNHNVYVKTGSGVQCVMAINERWDVAFPYSNESNCDVGCPWSENGTLYRGTAKYYKNSSLKNPLADYPAGAQKCLSLDWTNFESFAYQRGANTPTYNNVSFVDIISAYGKKFSIRSDFYSCVNASAFRWEDKVYAAIWYWDSTVDEWYNDMDLSCDAAISFARTF